MYEFVVFVLGANLAVRSISQGHYMKLTSRDGRPTGTIKHDASQLTVIRTPCLKAGVLFESFFAGNPTTVTENNGLSLSQLLMKTVNEPLDWTNDIPRERSSGACVGGQYIHLNLATHLCNILDLSLEFMTDSVIWDAEHRIELAFQRGIHCGKSANLGYKLVTGPSPSAHDENIPLW